MRTRTSNALVFRAAARQKKWEKQVVAQKYKNHIHFFRKLRRMVHQIQQEHVERQFGVRRMRDNYIYCGERQGRTLLQISGFKNLDVSVKLLDGHPAAGAPGNSAAP